MSNINVNESKEVIIEIEKEYIKKKYFFKKRDY